MFLSEGPDPRDFNTKSRELTDFISENLASVPRTGQNPDVFYYQIAQGTKGAAIIRMVFYGGFVIDAYSPQEGGISSGDA